jgi:hypothetical protein
MRGTRLIWNLCTYLTIVTKAADYLPYILYLPDGGLPHRRMMECALLHHNIVHVAGINWNRSAANNNCAMIITVNFPVHRHTLRCRHWLSSNCWPYRWLNVSFTHISYTYSKLSIERSRTENLHIGPTSGKRRQTLQPQRALATAQLIALPL